MISIKLKQVLKKNKFFYRLIKFYKKIQIKSINFIFEINANLRDKSIIKDRYHLIKSKYNIHYGKRCFIVATGPSLTVEDIEKLKEEYTISMNSICLAFDKTNWRPTYYGIQDEYVYEKVEKVLKDIDLNNVFISNNIAKQYSINRGWIRFPLNTAYHAYEQGYENKYFVWFSDDCHKRVYDGYTITYSLIQIASYMGFKEIYLLGCDCNYSDDKNKQHFIESGHYDKNYKTAGERMIEAYKSAKVYADSHNIKIYNATRGGSLEVFPRVNLDEILN